jgi:hypothetical protein
MTEAPGTHDPYTLPPNIPAPRMAREVNLSKLAGRTVLYPPDKSAAEVIAWFQASK